jgi:DNA-binding XRE family transcriptional regulator
MRQKMKIPRIIKIEKIDGHLIQCMFNNGESRLIDFAAIFKAWSITPNDLEYPLLDPRHFSKVSLRNYTLSWPGVTTVVADENGNEMIMPYEIGADVLYDLSQPLPDAAAFRFGKLIKKARLQAGLSQEEVASKSGTTRFYISKIENDKADLELSTFRKIVEAGLGKKLKLSIE